MPNNKSAVDEFLEDVNGKATPEADNDFGFPNPENMDGQLFEGVKPQEKEEEEEEEEPKKPLPFNKDPKVLKFIEKEVAKRLDNFKPEVPEMVTEERGDEIEDILTRIIGNDTPEKVSAVRDFKKVLIERENKGAEKAIAEWENRRQSELREEQEATAQLEAGLESIEETFNVDLTSNRKMRTEFLDFVEKIAPKDANGDVIDYPDFEETFRVFKEMKKPQPNLRAREIASRGLERTTEAKPQQPQDYSWRGVEKMLNELFNK